MVRISKYHRSFLLLASLKFHAVSLESSLSPETILFGRSELCGDGMEGLEHFLHSPLAEECSVINREVGGEHAPLGREELHKFNCFSDDYSAILPRLVCPGEERYLHVDVLHRSESLHAIPVFVRLDLLNCFREPAVVDDYTKIGHSVKHIRCDLVLMRIQHKLK